MAVYSMEKTAREVARRETFLRRSWFRRKIAGLSALSAVLCVTLTVCFGYFGRSAPPSVPALTVYGTILLGGGAGGYVLAGVIAFMAGAGITAACIRMQTKKKDGKNKEEEES